MTHNSRTGNKFEMTSKLSEWVSLFLVFMLSKAKLTLAAVGHVVKSLRDDTFIVEVQTGNQVTLVKVC